jgi:hypothetical protein
MFKNLFYACTVAAVIMTSGGFSAFASCANGNCPKEMIERHRQEKGYYEQQQQQNNYYQPQQSSYEQPTYYGR